MEVLRRETVKHGIVGKVTGNKLSLQMRGKLGNDEFVPRGYAGNFVAVGFAFGGTLQIEKPSVPGRNLHGRVSETCRPATDGVERVERRGIRGELCQEYARSLHCSHLRAPLAFARDPFFAGSVSELCSLPGGHSNVWKT
jgi:hypothetical protein